MAKIEADLEFFATELLALSERTRDLSTKSALAALSRKADMTLARQRRGAPCPDCGGTGRLPGDSS